MARTVLGKGLTPLLAANKRPEAQSASPSGAGVSRLLQGGANGNSAGSPAGAKAPTTAGAVSAATASPLPLWPFVLADALLVGAAASLFVVAPRPLTLWIGGLSVVLVSGGCLMTVLPMWWNARCNIQPPPDRERLFKGGLPVTRA